MAQPGRSRHARLRLLTSRVRSAREVLAAARDELGRLTTPDDPPVLVEARLKRLLRAVRQRGRRFLQHPGVSGFALAFVRKRGIETSRPCLTIYVARKLTARTLERHRRKKLPRYVQVLGRRIRVDVVALGRLRREAFVGQSLSTNVGGTRFGTIGARAVTRPGGTPALITAMHVTGLHTFPDPGVPTIPIFVPGGSQTEIGELLAGKDRGIDAALVSVKTSLSDAVPLIGQLRGWRSILLPGDRGTRVRMFGGQSRRLLDGVIEEPLVELPGFGLDLAIVVRGFESADGDSGAALVDPHNLVLGFLVGRTTSERRIFCPAGLVLKRLGCDIPSTN